LATWQSKKKKKTFQKISADSSLWFFQYSWKEVLGVVFRIFFLSALSSPRSAASLANYDSLFLFDAH